MLRRRAIFPIPARAYMQLATAVRYLITAIAVAMSVFHLYTGFFGSFITPIQNGVHLAFAMALILLTSPTKFRPHTAAGQWISLGWDALVAAACALPLWYRFQFLEYLQAGRFEFVSPLTPLEMVLGLAFVVAVLDLTRRLTGWPLAIIVIVFLVYPSIPHLPSVLGHGGYDLGVQLDVQYMTLAGIFSVPLTASAQYIALFIIFGAFLERSGLGGFIMDFAVGLVGHYRGGPAKVAVISSAMTGTLSGSAPANVLTTGVITIPMMKSIGYPAYMAGAIEAAASTGGVLMPPVMGAVAFIMAQYTGVPYIQIALIAFIPALLYFCGIFFTVHWSAVRFGVQGVDRKDLPDWRRSFLSRGHLLLPVVVLFWLMLNDYSPQYAVSWSILAVVVVSWLRKETRMGPSAIMEALEMGAKGALIVAIATAAAGMIVGVLELTGLGLRFAQAANSLVSTLFLALVMTMIVSIVLGMGVPPSVSYIVQIAVTIPMLQQFLVADGMDKQTALIVTHFFVMYYSSLAVLTPPDALAAVAASGVAQSPFLQTAWHGTRVAFVGFIVPFMFVYRPALLMLGTWDQIVLAVIFALLGVALTSVALVGYALRKLTIAERLIAAVAGLALIFPARIADIVGLGGLVLFVALQWWQGRRAAASAQTTR